MHVLDRLLTVPESAKLAGVSARTFWALISSGRTPAVVRIGRSVRLRASDMDLWIRLGCPSREVVDAEKASREGGEPK